MSRYGFDLGGHVGRRQFLAASATALPLALVSTSPTSRLKSRRRLRRRCAGPKVGRPRPVSWPGHRSTEPQDDFARRQKPPGDS